MDGKPLDPVKARMENIANTLTQPAEEHDLSLAGLRAPRTPRPAQQPTETKTIIIHTILELPKHFILQLARTVLPFLAQLSAFALGALLWRLSKDNCLLDRLSAAEAFFYAFYDSKSLAVTILANIVWSCCAAAWGGMYYWPLLLMWTYRVALPFVWQAFATSIVLNVVNAVSHAIAPLTFPPDLVPEPLWACLVGWWVGSMIVVIPYSVAYVDICWHALRALRNPVWCWMYLIYNMMIYTLAMVYLFALRFLMGMPDVAKLLFVVLVNAPLMEVLSVLSRFTARSARHNDPITSWMPICVAVVFKKLWMRFVVGSMESSVLVSLASVMVGVLEILGRVTMPHRDKWAYRKLFGKHLGDKSPLALMTHARSRTLRAETESLEGVLDMSFIIIGCVWPYIFRLSFDGKGLPSLTKLIEKAVIQCILESTLDVFICITMAVVQNYHILSHGKNKCKCWSLVVALITFSVTLMLPIQTMGFIVCTQKELPEDVEFAFCSTLHS